LAAHAVVRNLSAKLRKISVLQHKNGAKHTIFRKKSDFFRFFVCFLKTFSYICIELRTRVAKNLFINTLFKHIFTMNKTELVEKIAAGAAITKVDAKKALDAAVAAVKDALIAGDKVSLIGFGTFSVNERPAREGINPATKAKIKIAAKKVAKFKAGVELAEALN
jgi:DNA-binding protein HU-beta